VPKAQFAEILDEAGALFAASAAPSLALAIGVGNEVVAERAWGMSDLSQRVAATPDTAYLLASVTKPITATAVSLLAARHGISLDNPVSAFLGYRLRQVCAGPEPTPANLLGHRSGIGRYCRFFYADEPALPAADFRATAEEHVVVTTPPGQQYEYSNLGYGVLDEVIAAVSGVSAAEFIQREIFDVVGMTSAVIGPGYEGAAPAHAERYGADGSPYPAYDVEHRGASLGWATPGDVVRFGLSHCPGGAFGELPEIRRQHQPSARGPAVGFAWRIAAPGGVRVLSHSGGMGGVASLLLVCPSLGFAVATAVNQSYSTAARRVGYLAMSRLLSRATGREVDARPSAAEPETAPSAQGGHWAGEAVIGGERVAVELKITPSGDALIGRDAEFTPAVLRPLEGHDLRVAAAWNATGTPGRGGGTCLDLVRTGEGYTGKIAVTDLAGAGLREAGPDGGRPGFREAGYVTYPVVFNALRLRRP
jgi:CubicO group peptidase (beta-lactamase class C family)